MAGVWPAYLPQRGLREGFSRSPGENRIVSETDTDGGKSRARSSNAIDPIRLQMRFTTSQVELFWSFWRDELGHGTADFWFPAPATHGLIIASDDGSPLLTDTGAPIAMQDMILVRFALRQPPPAFEKRTALAYYASLSLEKLW